MTLHYYIDQEGRNWTKLISDAGDIILINESKKNPSIFSKSKDVAFLSRLLTPSEVMREVACIAAMAFQTDRGNWYVDVTINNKHYLFVTDVDRSTTLKSIKKDEYFDVLGRYNAKERTTKISLVRIAECVIHLKKYHAEKNSAGQITAKTTTTG